MMDVMVDQSRCIGCAYRRKIDPYRVDDVEVDAECTNPNGTCWNDGIHWRKEDE